MENARRKAANLIYMLAGWGLLAGSLAVSWLYQLWPGFVEQYQMQLSSLVTLLCIMVPAVVYFYSPLGRDQRAVYTVIPMHPATLLSIPMALGGFFFFTAVSGIFALIAEMLGYTPLQTTSVLIQQSGMGTGALVLIVAVAPAITEEFYFRGVLLPAYAAAGKWKAICLSAALFALLHGQPVSFPALFGVGIMLGYVSYQTRSIIPSILYHATHNLISVLLVQMASSLPGNAQAYEQTLPAGAYLASYITMLLFGAAVLGVCVFIFERIVQFWNRTHPGTASPHTEPVRAAGSAFWVYLPLAIGLAGALIINLLEFIL